MDDIVTVGICGFGTIGAGWAEVCSRNGYETIVLAKSESHLARGFSRVETSTSRAIERGKMTSEDYRQLLDRIHGTIDIRDLRQCDIVIEAVTEHFDVKRALLEALDSTCESKTLLASATSSLSITQLASVTERPAQVIGLHPLNPVPIMTLLEIVPGEKTAKPVVETAKGFVESLGKVPLLTADQNGFLVNRLLFPYLLDAVRLLESGVAERDDIDTAMNLGCNMPLGPLKLLDNIGLDTAKVIVDNLNRAYEDERFRVPALLETMLAEGKLGRKNGKGFYDY